MRRSDVAVDPDGDFQTTFGLGNQIISRFAFVHLRACASVDGKGGDAAIFGDAGDGRQVFVVVVPAQTGFEGNGNVHRADDGFENGGNQRLVLHQRAAGLNIADFFGGTAHVDVDNLRPEADVVTRGIRHLLRIAAGNLDGNDTAFIGKIAAAQGLFGISKRRVAGQHFAHRPTRAKISAKSAEGLVRNARHRGECNGIVDNVAADAHGQTAVWKGLPLYNF